MHLRVTTHTEISARTGTRTSKTSPECLDGMFRRATRVARIRPNGVFVDRSHANNFPVASFHETPDNVCSQTISVSSDSDCWNEVTNRLPVIRPSRMIAAARGVNRLIALVTTGRGSPGFRR